MTACPKKRLQHPFDCLRHLLDSQALPENSRPPESLPAAPDRHLTDEKRIFTDAMKDVAPICRANCPPERIPRPARFNAGVDEDGQVITALQGLVRSGAGFTVSDTSEYIEGCGYLAPPEITMRLHRGDFSIQEHLDLHGLSAVEAEAAFENFLRECIASGKRAVLIIHGRGLSSPAQPVLKTKVCQWLTRWRWRKWVIAFTSARSCDGGAGASYVLLRQRALRKSQCKKAFARRPAAGPR